MNPRPEFLPDGDPAAQVTVHHSRPLRDHRLLQADVVGADSALANLFLRFVEETAAVRGDEARLLEAISTFTFLAFPQATHQVVAVRDAVDGSLDALLARARSGGEPDVALSSTLVDRAMTEGIAFLFSTTASETRSSESLVLSDIRTAVCAPLQGAGDTFGVIQVDIRGGRGGLFSRKELDRITVFAHHVGLVLDNLRLAQDQQRALESTINALVHSLFLKDPDTAEHSQRVQTVSMRIGREMGIEGVELEALGMAALLHDLGKQGIRHEVLNKPARLDDKEQREMSHHSRMTQHILDMIHYPAPLRDVPRYAAYHHEKLDGTGPYRVAADDIPIPARIIAVADVFDALISPRVYKEPKPLPEVLAIFEKGVGKAWDPEVLDALRACLPDLLPALYERDEDGNPTRREAA